VLSGAAGHRAPPGPPIAGVPRAAGPGSGRSPPSSRRTTSRSRGGPRSRRSRISRAAPSASRWSAPRPGVRAHAGQEMGWEPRRTIKIVGVGASTPRRPPPARGNAGLHLRDAGSVLEAQGVGRILMRLDEVTPSGISLIATAHRRSAKARKDTLQRTLAAIFQGTSSSATMRTNRSGRGQGHRLARGGRAAGL